MQPRHTEDYPISGLVVPLTQLFPYETLRLASLYSLGHIEGLTNPRSDYQSLLEFGDADAFEETVNWQWLLSSADERAKELLLSSPRAMVNDQALRLLELATNQRWRIAIASTLPLAFTEELITEAGVVLEDEWLLHCDPCEENGRIDDLWYQRLYPRMNVNHAGIVIVEDNNQRASVVFKGERRVLFVSSLTRPTEYVARNAWRTADSLLEVNESLFLSPGSPEPRSSRRRVGLHPAVRSMRG